MKNKNFKASILDFIRKLQMEKIYQFRYTETINEPVLYNTLYAVMAWHLLDELKNKTAVEKRILAEYIRSFQCDDGLFRDDAVSDSPKVDGDGWGWTHLTQHAIMALSALGYSVEKEFKYVEPFYDRNHTLNWLEWKSKNDMWNFGNAVMYIVNMLEYMRDSFGDKQAQPAIKTILDFLSQIQDKETGLWREDIDDTPSMLSRGVQISYHIWELYFYDKQPIQYMEKAIDSLLATQNFLGGYSLRPNSSGCEDIDAVIPLARFYFLTDYRQADIEDSLKRAFNWVMSNMNADGGFVNMRDEAFEYGHPKMRNEKNQSDLFSSWWRPLSLAYMSKVIDNELLKSVNWQFVNAPGYSFWFKD